MKEERSYEKEGKRNYEGRTKEIMKERNNLWRKEERNKLWKKEIMKEERKKL